MNDTQFNIVFDWMIDHVDHVENLVNDGTNQCVPSMEDLAQPNLYKGCHWRWYINSNDITGETK